MNIDIRRSSAAWTGSCNCRGKLTTRNFTRVAKCWLFELSIKYPSMYSRPPSLVIPISGFQRRTALRSPFADFPLPCDPLYPMIHDVFIVMTLSLVWHVQVYWLAWLSLHILAAWRHQPPLKDWTSPTSISSSLWSSSGVPVHCLEIPWTWRSSFYHPTPLHQEVWCGYHRRAREPELDKGVMGISEHRVLEW